MLNAVTVTNHLGDSLTMELRNPEKSGFLITSITGIGAPKADIHVTDLAAIDGGYYNSARAGNRNIVFGIRFFSEDNTNIEALRQKTYKYFPIKRNITLRFEADNRIGEISGYVESNEPNIFSKEEDCQISVICPYPYFYDASGNGVQTIRFSSTIPAFQFVYSNELTSENEYSDKEARRHTLFSEYSISHRHVFVYSGDADTGMEIILSANGSVINPSFYNATSGEQIYLNTTMRSGDQIVIDTTRGNKNIRRIRNGKYSNIINTMARSSLWPTLWQGENDIGYSADDGTNNLSVSISYKTIFEGM